MGSNKNHYAILVLTLLYLQQGMAQNTTSPYSILGIGDIETKDFGRWYGMGSTSIALSSPWYINTANPASLTALNERMMNFDIANRGKSASFKYATADTFTANTKDFSVRRISLAFKPNKKNAFAVGLKPFSTINYLLLQNTAVYSSNTSLAKSVDGSGGINQVYLSYARQLTKGLSVGITSSYYFGSANIATDYYGESLSVALSRQQYTVMNAFQLQAGLQYNWQTSPWVTHRLGFTISNPATIKRYTETEYLSNSVSVKSTTETKKDFTLPLQMGIGYAISFNNNLTLSADALYSNWQKQKVEYNNSYTTPSGRISAGIEYVNRKKIGSYSVESWYLQAGASAEKNYFTILGKDLNTYAVSAGFGKNLSTAISLYGGIEMGTRGSTNSSQIKEKFTQYIIGFTLKEFWFNYRKYGRYQ
ncbi:MAG TPA: hypothetical protein PKC39_11185 [Ferruginibacter sp.]|nr:hypothetical protein [Ferruginibacter sp.]HMP21512.1 hypothetical protein [Ferruginibacter sp.]